VGQPFLFNSAGGTGSALEQVTVDGDVYIVGAGTGAEGVYAWWSNPTTTGLAVQINWEGVGTADSIAALRVDVEAP
jgi:hypothetical protein